MLRQAGTGGVPRPTQPASQGYFDLKEIIKPWGSEKLLATGERYAVKEITVNPDSRISLQSHKHRSEVWTVTQGEGWLTNGDSSGPIAKGDSTFISMGSVHRVENRCTVELLVFVEVQYGKRCLDDDIVRYEDDYGRLEVEREQKN